MKRIGWSVSILFILTVLVNQLWASYGHFELEHQDGTTAFKADGLPAELQGKVEQLLVAVGALDNDQTTVQFEIQMGTSDLQNAENVRALLTAISALDQKKSTVQFEIQMATSDLQNAENVRRLMTQLAALEDQEQMTNFEIQD